MKNFHKSPARKSEESNADLLQSESGNRGTGNGTLSIAWVYPNSYSVAMASLGYQIVRTQIRDLGFTRIERSFAEPAMGRTLESGRSLNEFDVVAFSLAFELDYLHILQIMEKAGIPLFASKRTAQHPLIVIGGVAISVNRHPIYPFADVLVHGDGEEIVEPLFRSIEEWHDNRKALLERLREMKGIEPTMGAIRAAGLEPSTDLALALLPDELDDQIEAGTVEPGLHLEPPEPVRLMDLAPWNFVSEITTPNSELGEKVLAEIARGCPHRCTFCWVGQTCRRYLPRDADTILSRCEEAFEATGCSSVGLIAAAVGAHPEIDKICEGLMSKGRKISFSSLRAEEIQSAMLEALVHSGQRGLTLAPEVGTALRRKQIGKSIPDDVFFDAIERSQQAGLENLKLYFMIGLPYETDEAVDEIVAFVQHARHIMQAHGRQRGRLGELSVNIGIFVPKHGTPLADEPSPPFQIVRHRARHLANVLGAVPNVTMAPLSVDMAAAQRFLSVGGFESASLLLEVLRTDGNWRGAVRKRIRKG